MFLESIQQKQKQLITEQIQKLLNLLQQTEQQRDVSNSPIDRARYEIEIDNLKFDIENYKQELSQLEIEIVSESKKKYL